MSTPASRPEPVIRDATAADHVVLSHVLARSFYDDPVMMHLLPDDDSRLRRLGYLFKAELWSMQRRGRILTTDDFGGASLWAPPKLWRTPKAEMVRQSPWLLRAFGRRAASAERVLRQVEAAHPEAPHWFLAVLGTDPDRQGTGIGGALLRRVTDELDAEGQSAYLESSKERNVGYYERFGFRVTGEVHLTNGPTLWLMWRDPQVPES